MLRSLFARPEWLHLLWILPVFILLLRAYLRWRSRALSALGPKSEQLIAGFTARRFWVKNGLLIAVLALLALAMANPWWGSKTRNQTQKAADVMIALDISKSMLATDIKPDRLLRARLFAQELIRKISGNRVGLLFFAGEAYLSMPLSTDYQTVNSLLAEADPESYSAQGTAISAVLELARKSFDPEDGAGRALVIITDGEDHEEDPQSAVEEAYDEDGIVTFVVGAGTEDGGPIPLSGGGILKDQEDKPVVSKLGMEMLNDIATAGHGAPPFLLTDNGNLSQKLADEINALEKRNIEVRSFEEKNSIFQWLLLPAILALFLERWLGWRIRNKE